MSTPLPQEFTDALKAHFGLENALRVMDSMQGVASTSIRVNPLKAIDPPEGSRSIPWSRHGHVLEGRPNFALDPLFHAGCYYVQDASGMILEKVLEKINPNPNGLFLDACAAPGGKSTILLDYLQGRGLLIANETDPQRNAVLRENLLKWGHFNQAVTSLPTSKFADSEKAFDLILVDAPCSGEGMFRKDDFARKQWSAKLVLQCSALQSKIVEELTPALKPGGYMVYLTCTMNRHENEEQVLKLLATNEFELNLPDLSEFSEYLLPAVIDGTTLGYYLLPGISMGEGLFISVLKKSSHEESRHHSGRLNDLNLEAPDSAFKDQFPGFSDKELTAWKWKDEVYLVSNAELMPHALYYKRIGLPAYQIKGSSLIPLHGLAMAPSIRTIIDLDHDNSLRYLRKESIYLPSEKARAWQLVGYQKKALGWIKIIDRRINNYYPQGLKLRI